MKDDEALLAKEWAIELDPNNYYDTDSMADFILARLTTYNEERDAKIAEALVESDHFCEGTDTCAVVFYGDDKDGLIASLTAEITKARAK